MPKNYTLYIDNNCRSCKKTISFIVEQNIPISIVNIDEEDYKLPFSLMIIPALVNGDKLMCYGPDIISCLGKLTF